MDDEELCFEYLRDLITSARQGDNKRYVEARKRIKALMKKSAIARHFFKTATRSISRLTGDTLKWEMKLLELNSPWGHKHIIRK